MGKSCREEELSASKNTDGSSMKGLQVHVRLLSKGRGDPEYPPKGFGLRHMSYASSGCHNSVPQTGQL